MSEKSSIKNVTIKQDLTDGLQNNRGWLL